MISLIEALILLPWGGVTLLTASAPLLSSLPCLLLVGLLSVIGFYSDTVAKQRIDTPRLTVLTTLVSIFTSLGVSFYLSYQSSAIHHGLTVGVVLASCLLLLATLYLARSPPTSQGLLVGYSAAGLPLYSSQRAPPTSLNWIKPILGQILDNTDSRRIFYFLILNLVSNLYIYLSIYISIYLSIYLYIYLYIYLSNYL